MIVPLTGGYDSRLLTAAISTVHRPHLPRRRQGLGRRTACISTTAIFGVLDDGSNIRSREERDDSTSAARGRHLPDYPKILDRRPQLARTDDGDFALATLDRELAAFPSAYGWRFTEPPPLRSRLRRIAKQRIPGLLRQRWQHHVRRRRSRDATLPIWMGPEYERALFGADPWLMDEFVAVDRIRTRNERNLVLSLELLLRAFS